MCRYTNLFCFTLLRRYEGIICQCMTTHTCALTQAEMYVTGEHKHEIFMGRLVGPMHKMPDTQVNRLTKTLFSVLWAFVQYRLGHFDSFIPKSIAF